MARTIKAEEHAAKRNEILNAVLQLIYTKGYERMTIQDILSMTGISSGAFYHYFDTKPAVLEALVEKMQEEAKATLLPAIHAPHLDAIEKLQAFFNTIDTMRLSQKTRILELIRVWYNDDNAIVRQKVDAAILAWRAPLITELVHQGIQEERFNTAYPDYAGIMIVSLLQGMANYHAKLMLGLESDSACVEAIVSSHTAYMDAIERLLGAAPNSLTRINYEAVSFWVSAVRANP
jgi:AcrR family transcriptional regulator